MQYNDLDGKLVSLLSQNGRASYRDLSRQTGVSRAIVAKRIHELEEGGDLAVVAVRHPDLSGARARVHLSISVRSEITPVVAALANHPQTLLVTTTAGRHNITVECQLKSSDDLNGMFDLVRSRAEVAQMDVTHYTKLLRGPYGPPTQEALSRVVDKLDLAVLNLLAQDARVPFVDIASSLGISASAARRRVEVLVASGAVRFVPISRRRGERRFPTLGFGVNGTGDHATLRKGLLQIRSLEYLVESTGRYNFIGTIIEPSAWDLASALSSLCAIEEAFEVRTWLHLAVHKEEYAHYGWMI